jgi:hypothetical protein
VEGLATGSCKDSTALTILVMVGDLMEILADTSKKVRSFGHEQPKGRSFLFGGSSESAPRMRLFLLFTAALSETYHNCKKAGTQPEQNTFVV